MLSPGPADHPETLVCAPPGCPWAADEVRAGTLHLPSSGFGLAAVCGPRTAGPNGIRQLGGVALCPQAVGWFGKPREGALSQGPGERREDAEASEEWPYLLGCSQPVPGVRPPEAACPVPGDSEPGPSRDLRAVLGIPRPQHRYLLSSTPLPCPWENGPVSGGGAPRRASASAPLASPHSLLEPGSGTGPSLTGG